jgi:hypothetical protein
VLLEKSCLQGNCWGSVGIAGSTAGRRMNVAWGSPRWPSSERHECRRSWKRMGDSRAASAAPRRCLGGRRNRRVRFDQIAWRIDVSAAERAPLIAAYTGPIAAKADGRPALPTPGEIAEVARGAYEIGPAIATCKRSTRRWRARASTQLRSLAPRSCTPRPGLARKLVSSSARSQWRFGCAWRHEFEGTQRVDEPLPFRLHKARDGAMR